MEYELHNIIMWIMVIITIIIIYFLFFHKCNTNEGMSEDTFRLYINNINGKWNINLNGMNDQQMQFVTNALSITPR